MQNFADFRWTSKAKKAALAVADGMTRKEAAQEAGASERTIYVWLKMPAFTEEVDRLTLMLGIAAKAERIRMIKQTVRKIGNNTNKDLLDWLKYAQSETDGIKLDLTRLLVSVTEDDT